MEGSALRRLADVITSIYEIRVDIISEEEAGGSIIMDKPLFIIANTDPSWEPGRHWVAFYFQNGQVPQFFDSFGREPSAYAATFEKFLLENSPLGPYAYNTLQIQQNGSNVCGLYCMAFLLSKLNDTPFKDFAKQWSTHSFHRNDVQCVRLIENYFDVKFAKY